MSVRVCDAAVLAVPVPHVDTKMSRQSIQLVNNHSIIIQLVNNINRCFTLNGVCRTPGCLGVLRLPLG